MKLGAKLAIAAILVSGLSIGVAFLWLHYMERKLVAERVDQSEHSDQAYFAMRKFLQRQGIAVEIRDNLSEVQALASVDDAIYLPTASSAFPNSLAKPLIAWIGKGGTLLAQTPWHLDSTDEHLFRPLGLRILSNSSDEEEETEDTTEGSVSRAGHDSTTDSVSEDPDQEAPRIVLHGLPGDPMDSSVSNLTDSVTTASDEDEDESEAELVAVPDSGMAIRLPGVADSLFAARLGWENRMIVEPPATMAWFDTLDSTTLVIQRGRGFAIATANSGRFEGFELQALDHAEILLRLLSWRQKPSTLWIVRNNSVMPWWAWLLDRAWAVLAVSFLLAGLWLWNRIGRFGPPLPDPDPDRRPLLEHIDASARWIWNSPGGPQTLLTALRVSVKHDLAVRHPQWVGLSPSELAEELGRLHGMSASAVRRALEHENDKSQPTALSPQELVRMVKLLQKLKERA